MHEPARAAPNTGTGISAEPVRWGMDGDRVMRVWFDALEKAVNTLGSAAWQALDAAVCEIEAVRPAGVVFASGKPRSFIAGADLFELRSLTDDELDAYLARGQRILDRIAALSLPTVAAINGDALGGGLELAIACRYRVVADDPRVKLGLPETTLGLVPGWGGTIRLPRLVGLEPALALMLPGTSIPPQEALALGLVDRLAPPDQLDAASVSLVHSPPAGHERPRDLDPQERRAVLARFRDDTSRRSGNHLPASLRLLDIVEVGYDVGAAAAAGAERRGLIELRRTAAAQNLLRLFVLRSAARKAAAAAAGGGPRPVRRAVVIGGGTMGAGIARILAAAGVQAEIVAADARSAAAALTRVAGLPGAATVPVTTGWGAVGTADLVVEAVVEDLAVKQDIFRRLDRQARPDAVLASNTSSLRIEALADVVCDPGRVIGLHFFNPVAKMPLVEVVRPLRAVPDAVATGVAVATLAGKTPVVCRDASGFIVNRVLFPYLRAALLAAEAGDDVQSVDAAVRAWGLPMGPFALIDQIGLDVTAAIFRSLEQALGARLAAPRGLTAMVARGWLGRKVGRGFYDHPPEGRPAPNPDRATAYPAAARPAVAGDEGRWDGDAVAARLIGPMADEARNLLDEGVVGTADTIDLATVLGIGFPAFRGGLATFAGLAGLESTRTPSTGVTCKSRR